jgi:hypothetical protein
MDADRTSKFISILSVYVTTWPLSVHPFAFMPKRSESGETVKSGPDEGHIEHSATTSPMELYHDQWTRPQSILTGSAAELL